MNEAFLLGTKLTRMTPATHWNVEKSTTFPSATDFVGPPGYGIYHSVLLMSLAL